MIKIVPTVSVVATAPLCRAERRDSKGLLQGVPVVRDAAEAMDEAAVGSKGWSFRTIGPLSTSEFDGTMVALIGRASDGNMEQVAE
jgi:hypothetical protein